MEEAEGKMINEFLKNFFDGNYQEIGDLYLGSIDGISVYAHPGFINGVFIVEVIKERSTPYLAIKRRINNVGKRMDMEMVSKGSGEVELSGIKYTRLTFVERTYSFVTKGLFKRFQYLAKDGVVKWTKWFPCLGTNRSKVQYKNLKNEYEQRD